jgi:dodecin
MMTNNEFRRGYDERYDLDGARRNRSHDPRWAGGGGDWMRESTWMRDAGLYQGEGEGSPLLRVIEVFAQSPHSWEDATRRAVAEAARTIGSVRSVRIADMNAIVDDDHVVSFRISAKIAVVLDDNRRRR